RARRSELLKRLEQLSADVAREQQLVSENADILARLEDEEQELLAANEDSGDRGEELRILFEEAENRLAESEEQLANATAERAEAVAERSQIERGLKETQERRNRIAGQIESLDRDIVKVVEQ